MVQRVKLAAKQFWERRQTIFYQCSFSNSRFDYSIILFFNAFSFFHPIKSLLCLTLSSSGLMIYSNKSEPFQSTILAQGAILQSAAIQY